MSTFYTYSMSKKVLTEEFLVSSLKKIEASFSKKIDASSWELEASFSKKLDVSSRKLEASFSERIDASIEGLARMVERGFEETVKKAQFEEFKKELENRFAVIDAHLREHDGRFDVVDGALARIEVEIRDLRKDWAAHEIDVHELRRRVTRIEKKLGINR